MKKMKVRVTLITEMLGTFPTDPDIYVAFIEERKKRDTLGLFPKDFDIKKELENISRAAKANDWMSDENPDNNPNVITTNNPKVLTAFPRDENYNLIMYDYQIRGFFKEACGSLRSIKDSEWGKESTKIKNYKKVIDGGVFVTPEYIPIHIAEGKTISIESRSLRAQSPTPPYERVCISSSETVPRGSWFEFEIMYPDSFDKAIKEWMDYGAFKGFLQWRSGGKGRFTYEILE